MSKVLCIETLLDKLCYIMLADRKIRLSLLLLKTEIKHQRGGGGVQVDTGERVVKCSGRGVNTLGRKVRKGEKKI